MRIFIFGSMNQKRMPDRFGKFIMMKRILHISEATKDLTIRRKREIQVAGFVKECFVYLIADI